MTQRSVIIGGGVGGLAAGIGLRNEGLDVRVLERRGDLQQAGFGMVLWPNGTRALQALGVLEGVREIGCELQCVEFRTPENEVLRGWSIAELAERAGTPAIAVSRSALHGVLADEAKALIKLNSTSTAVDYDDAAATVHVLGQPDEHADFVIAADGVRSRTRGEMLGMPWPQYPPYAGYTIWHAVIDGAGLDIPMGTFVQYLGQNSRFVCTRIDAKRVYWSALGFVPQGGAETDESFLDTVRARYRGWTNPIPSLFEATRPDQVARRDIFGGRPLPRWGSGRLTLLGDAAHPMTTVLAQGGCMALEDAAVLAQSVRGESDTTAALRSYEQRRIARSSSMMALISRFNPGGPESGLKVAVRNKAIKYAFGHGVARKYERLVLQNA